MPETIIENDTNEAGVSKLRWLLNQLEGRYKYVIVSPDITVDTPFIQLNSVSGAATCSSEY